MPTLDEINAAAPETPVFILHLYDRALLNRAALRVLGYDENPPAFDRGVIERDAKGRADRACCVAKPSAAILYGTLGRAPRALARGPGQLVAPLHARAEPPRRHERDRRGRRRAELSRTTTR